MESANPIESYVRRAGVVAGVALVAVAMLAFRVPGGSGSLGADVIVAVSPTGELGVDPAGPFLTATGLRPGSSASDDFRVTNQTGKSLAVGLRALPDSRDLDHVLALRVTAGSERLFAGRLGSLRTSTRRFVLAPGEQQTMRVRASLPAGTRDGWIGRISTVKLELNSAVMEPRRG